MLITIDNNVFSALKTKFAGKFLSDEYVKATTVDGSETIGLPIYVSDIDDVAGLESPFLVVSYEKADWCKGNDVSEDDCERCDTLEEAVNLMVNNVEWNKSQANRYYCEICVDDNVHAIYDVMWWNKDNVLK